MPMQRVDFKHVRENASFEAVAAHYNLKLQGRADQRTALCCFHDEDSASLKIHLGKRIFNCFGCGAHGNILDFVTRMEGGNPDNDTDLRAGAFKLAEICGIDPLPASRGVEPAKKKDQVQVKRPAKQPAKAEPEPVVEAKRENKPLNFTLRLDGSHPYLTERGISRETIEAFGIGYCGRGLMKGRIAIPIHNEKGELIAYAGRWASKEVPKDTPKYLLPEGFEKQSVLFNMNRIEPMESVRRPAIIVESYWSAMRLHSLGYPVVSPMGHSISEEQCKLLASRRVEKVIVLFDGDEAGELGIKESVPILSRWFYVLAPVVPAGFKPHKASDEQIAKLTHFSRSDLTALD